MIKRIVIENNEAKGVELDDGTILKAKQFVCSSLNPHQTFYDYVGKEYLPPGADYKVGSVEVFRYELLHYPPCPHREAPF